MVVLFRKIRAIWSFCVATEPLAVAAAVGDDNGVLPLSFGERVPLLAPVADDELPVPEATLR